MNALPGRILFRGVGHVWVKKARNAITWMRNWLFLLTAQYMKALWLGKHRTDSPQYPSCSWSNSEREYHILKAKPIYRKGRKRFDHILGNMHRSRDNSFLPEQFLDTEISPTQKWKNQLDSQLVCSVAPNPSKPNTMMICHVQGCCISSAIQIWAKLSWSQVFGSMGLGDPPVGAVLIRIPSQYMCNNITCCCSRKRGRHWNETCTPFFSRRAVHSFGNKWKRQLNEALLECVFRMLNMREK